jgi:two-component system phosphate regulon sensor histidine kinase PhoR
MSQELVEAIPIPAVLVDSDGRIAATNASARNLFGEAIEGRHYITVLRQPSLLDAVERAINNGTTTRAQYLTTEARRDLTLQATCTRLSGGRVFLCFEDRTAMEEAFQMRRDFVANVSHELRTPLTALMGFIETLGGAARDDSAARSRFLGIMHKEASRMNRLVGDLLSLSRVEAEERMRPTQPVDFVSVVRSVLHTLAPMAEAEGIALETVLSGDDIVIPGDSDQLSQVVTNLVENAIKYSRADSTVRISVATRAQHPDIRQDALVLAVEDEGEGIDAIHIPRLTERFYRIDAHRSREMGGTGLGLAIVKHIVNRHRGRLRIESEKGKGSKFSVILPLKAAEGRRS